MSKIYVSNDLKEIVEAFKDIVQVSYYDGIKILIMWNSDIQRYRDLNEMCENFYELCIKNQIYFIKREARGSNKSNERFNFYRINTNNTATDLGDMNEKRFKNLSREYKIRSVID